VFLMIFPNVDVILQQCYNGLSKFLCLATEMGQVLVGAGRVQSLNLKQKY